MGYSLPDGAEIFTFEEMVDELRLVAGQPGRPGLRPRQAGLAQRALHPRAVGRRPRRPVVAAPRRFMGCRRADRRQVAWSARATPLVQERMQRCSTRPRHARLPARRRRVLRRGRRRGRQGLGESAPAGARGGADGSARSLGVVRRRRRSRRRCAARWSTASASSRVSPSRRCGSRSPASPSRRRCSSRSSCSAAETTLARGCAAALG